MLVLPRAPGQWLTVTVPPSAEPTIIRIKLEHGNRLIFDAPRRAQIVRDEAVNKEPRA